MGASPSLRNGLWLGWGEVGAVGGAEEERTRIGMQHKKDRLKNFKKYLRKTQQDMWVVNCDFRIHKTV